MCSFALLLLVLQDVSSLDLVTTVDALYANIWTNGFVVLNLALDTLCTAVSKCFTLNCVILTFLIMVCDFKVIQNNVTTHYMISTFKLHLHKFLFNFFLDAYETRLRTLHRTCSSLSMKFLQTFIMKSSFTRPTFNWINQNSLTQTAEILWLELILRDQILSVKLMRSWILHICLWLWFWKFWHIFFCLMIWL